MSEGEASLPPLCDFYDHKAKLALQGSQALVTIRNAYLSNIWTDLRSQ